MFPIFLLGWWADRTCFFMVMTEALTEAQEGKRISSSHLHHVYLYPVDESKSCDQNHSQQVEKYTLCTEKPGHGCGYKGVKTWGKRQNLSHIAISGFKGTGKYNPPCVPRRMIENICWTPLKIFSGMSQSPYNGLMKSGFYQLPNFTSTTQSSSWHSSPTPSKFLPQGLCTYNSFCQRYSFIRYLHDFISYVLWAFTLGEQFIWHWIPLHYWSSFPAFIYM